MSRLRIATVPYVNAAPLVWGLTHGPQRDRVEVLAAPPARIPDLLRSGRVDAGLVPVIATQDLDDCVIHPALCIASLRRARSVLLVSRRPLERVQSVALDASSRSSAALLRVLLSVRGLGGIAFTEQPPSLAAMLETNDAALLIGDAALQADTRDLVVLDLAAEWFALTGLPFVFAVWAVRRAALPRDVADPFMTSYRHGLEHLGDIVAEAAPRLGIDPRLVAEYLGTNIHYRLGREERRAIGLFFERSHAIGLTGAPRPLRLIGPEDDAGSPASGDASRSVPVRDRPTGRAVQ